MSSVEQAPFSTIQEEDIDWGNEDLWGQSQPEDWACSSVGGGKDASAPWDGHPDAMGPDPRWTSTQEGSAWGAFSSVTQRRRPSMRSMTAGKIQGPPGLHSMSNVKKIETKNRFEGIAPEIEEDDDEKAANCSCGHDHTVVNPNVRVLLQSEVQNKKAENQRRKRLRQKEA